MTVLEELKIYCEYCLEDIYISKYEDYISCQKHKWACQRFLNDLNRIGNEDFPYIWDEKEAQLIVDWFTFLRHSKGVLAGEPIFLNPWQKFCLCQIYGWRNKDTGYKRFNKSFIEVARKNAKSQMEAGVDLYEISTQSTKNNEIYETYCAGTKREQSEIIFNEAINLIGNGPLRSKFKISKKQITHIKTSSFLKTLCKEDGKKGDGTNPAVLILDEYHQHENTDFYDLALGSNTKESLLMIITTAGKDLSYPCYVQEYEYCSSILNPNIDVSNDEYFIDILEIDKNDDVTDERIWKKANPIRMTYEEGWQKIKSAYEVAKNIPEKMIAFKTKCLNIWIQAKENGYMDMAKWKECEVDKIPYNLKGKTVFVGLDMSSKIDLTSIAFIIPIKSDRVDINGQPIVEYIVFSHSFIPNKEKLTERTLKDKVPYDAWEEQNYISITNAPIVDQQFVMNYILKVCKENDWKINTLCFDPANSSKFMTDVAAQGYVVEEVYQSHKSLNEATQGFREEVYSKNVIYTKNPVLNFAMSNAVIKTNNGLIKIDKDATKKKIDPVDAVLCAYKLARYYEFTEFDDDEWLESDDW